MPTAIEKMIDFLQGEIKDYEEHGNVTDVQTKHTLIRILWKAREFKKNEEKESQNE